MPSWKKEFPDYPVNTMPEIPAGFIDTSWHNDMCPSFEWEHAHLSLWVDFPDPETRDLGPDVARYVLIHNGLDVLLATNSWDEMVSMINKLRT